MGRRRRLDGANLSGAAFEAAGLRPRPPVASPEPVAAPAAPLPRGRRPGRSARPGRPCRPRRKPATEQHWRDVFRDFVRTRGECRSPPRG